MRQILMTAACAGALTALATPTSVTNKLTQVLNTGADSTETINLDYWTDGRVAHADADYLIDLKDPVRLPSTNSVFNGNSLQLGTDAVRANFCQKPGTLDFRNDGLYLKNVIWEHWAEGCHRTIGGRVTVLSTQEKPSQFCSSNKNAGHELTGALFGDTTAGLEAYVSTAKAEHTYEFRLSGDLSDYYGRIRVYKTAAITVGSTTMPGSLWMDNASGAGYLRTVANDTVATFGSLTLASGTLLEMQAELPSGATPAKHNGFRVTDALSVTGPVFVKVPSTLASITKSDELRIPFLTKAATATGELKVEDFVLTNATTMAVDELHTLEVETDGDSGDTTLYLVRKPVIVLERDTTTTDVNPSDTSKKGNFGALSTTNFWSDAQIPQPGRVYHSNGKVLRSYFWNGAADPKMSDVFAGDALIVNGTFVLQAPEVVITNFYLRKSSTGSKATVAIWHPNGDKSTNAFAVGGTKVIKGNRLVLQEDSTFSFSGIGTLVRLDAPIEGPGQLSFSVNDGAQGAYLEFAGDNSKWTGDIYASVGTGTGRPVFNYENTGEILFREARNLGGPRATFNYAALTLQKKSVLHPLQSVTLDEPTRGVLIQDQGGGIRTDAGTVLTLKNQLTLQGTLGKLGEGSLVLGGRIAFNGASTFTPGDKTYTIDVQEGGLRAVETNAVDGVTFTFGETGALEADPEATGDVATYGLYDVLVDAPFGRAPNGFVPVRLVLPTSYTSAAHPISATICTVNATAAANLGVNAFAVERPPKCRTYVTARTNADGTVTYTANVAPSGMIFTIR